MPPATKIFEEVPPGEPENGSPLYAGVPSRPATRQAV
jgi:hypothetical protein